MSGLPWFKCSPRDFREGMMGLTCEERGAYATILLLIYERGEPIPDDAPWICANLTISGRTWTKIRAALIVRGKLFEAANRGVPCLMNRRAETEICEQSKLREKLASGGRRAKSARETNKNNDVGLTRFEPSSSPANAEPLKREEVREENSSPIGESPPSAEIIPFEDVLQVDPAKEAFDAYNVAAQEIGNPRATKLTPDRRRRIQARLREHGLDGWMDAMRRLRVSLFLQGQNERGWKADLEFFMQPKSLQRTLEGAYERSSNARWSTHSGGRHQQTVNGMFEGLVGAVNDRR